MLNFKKNLLIFLAIFCLLISPAIARAEYTCCSCQANTEICHTGGICESSRQFIGFACATGDRTCSYVCPSGEFTNIPRTSAGGPVTWEAYTGDANINARGNVVTCCKCTDNTKICQNVNQTCTIICGTHGFESTLDSWYRSPTDESGAEGGGTRTTTPPGTESPYAQPNEPSSVGFQPPEPQAPNINLPIPGFVGFSQVKVQGPEGEQTIDIPWIAEYVKAIYNYMTAIGSSLAAFMFIVAGFQYVLARGDKGKIDKAKKRIENSLVGLFMLLGAYIILYTINPNLTSFESISLNIAKRNELKFEEGTGTGTYTLPSDEDVASESSTPPSGQRSASQYCRFIAPPNNFLSPRTDLRLDRINIRGENETRCPSGAIYTREMVDAVLAAQRATGIPAGFLLAQAQHETRNFRQSIESGQIPETLWGRKCGAGGTDVYKQARSDCNLRRQPSAESALRTSCEAAGCQVISTIEPCNASTGENVPAWACFSTTSGRGGFAGAAMEQATFYRDRIGRSCRHCGTLDQYEGSVMGFAARMSCSLTGGFQNSKWDNSLYTIIRQNCLEDSRNATLITLSATLGPDRGASTGGVNARDPNLCPDPYDSGKIANSSAAWCASAR